MHREISRTGKNGSYTRHQDVQMLNGDVIKTSIRLSQESSNFGRTIWLRGGNVPVKHDGKQWVQCGPYDIA